MSAGCVQRRMTVRSNPPGALVYVDDYQIGTTPVSVEWEDCGMDREHGATEACEFVQNIDFAPSNRQFDSAFDKEE